MSRRRARSSTPPSRWGRIALITFGVLLGLLIVGWFAGKAWTMAYLRSPEFHQFVNQRVGRTLRAEVGFAPFEFQGLGVFSNSVEVQGYEGAPFAKARVEQIRAQFSLRRFFEKIWQVETLEVQRLSLNLNGTRVSPPPGMELRTESAPATKSGWLPNRVEIGNALIRDFEITWGDVPSTAGALRGVTVEAVPADGGWNFIGRGGELTTGRLPLLTVQELALRQRGTKLFVNTARFTAQTGGTLDADGEVEFGRHVDLRAKLGNVDLQPLLSPDWRLKLHGRISGDVRVETPLPMRQDLKVTGTLNLSEGRLEALPVLNQIATFTRTQQFRSIALTRGSARFTRTEKQVRIENLVAESSGLMCVEGALTIVDGQIDGNLLVGVAPSTLQWIPGSQDRVFTTVRDGYLWTPVRLTGPVDSPNEDLTGRLVAAAGGAVIDKAAETARDALDLGRDAVKGALDFIMPGRK